MTRHYKCSLVKLIGRESGRIITFPKLGGMTKSGQKYNKYARTEELVARAIKLNLRRAYL